MAKLREGMKQVRTPHTWGKTSTHYEYKGVRIRKHRDSWTFGREVQMMETGKIVVSDGYADCRLTGAADIVEIYLKNPNYILDTACGVFRLSEVRKSELKTGARQRVMDEMKALEDYLTQYLQEKNWDKLASMADRMKQFTTRNAWVFEVEDVTV